MDYIRELNASGAPVGTGGHSRDNFSSATFVVQAPRESYQHGVPSSTIDFTTGLISGSVLTVSTHIFLQAGTITPTENESWMVDVGTVKFTVTVSAWPFCSGTTQDGACSGATGDYLEFGMAIQGSDQDMALTDGPKRYALATNAVTGAAIRLDLSDQVNIDGLWRSMPSGYPRVVMRGQRQLFVFRFPRFSSSAIYDPVVSGLDIPSSPPVVPSSQGLRPYHIFLAVVSSAALIISLLVLVTRLLGFRVEV